MTERNSELFQDMQVRTTAFPDQLLHYSVALLSVALALGTTLLLGSYLETTLTSLFFVAVMVSAWYGGLKPGIVATVLSTLAINYFLIEPIYALSIPDLGTLVRLGVFVMAAILISSLNAAQRLAQRRAEVNFKSLRESEARFGCLVESNIIGMMVAELSGVILEANDAFLQMVGYTQEELRSGRLRWNEMTPPEFLEVSNQAVQELITTGASSPLEKEYVRKDGSRVPVLHGAIMTGEATVTGFVLDLSERKRAEETLQRTNQTLQTVLNACPVAIAFFDPQGIVRVWNGAAERIFGWSAAEAIGQFMPTVPHRRQEFLASIQTVLSGQSLNGFEAQHRHKNGHMVDLEIWANLAHDAEGNPGCLGIAWDITERKHAEALLRTSEERYRLLVATTTALVWTTNAEGQFISDQSSWEAYTGQRWEEYAGWGWLEMFHSEDREGLKARWEHALANRSYYEAEGRLWHAPSGQYRHILACAVPLLNADGSVREWIGMDTDIHDRKQVEETLRHSEARFQVLVSNMPGMVYRYALGADGVPTFTYVSSGSRNLVELEPETILQDAGTFLRLIHPDDLSSFQSSVAIAIENSAVWQWEGRIITPSGQLKWIQGRSRPQETEYGEAWDGLLFDVTDRKQAEEALRQSEERLRVALKSSPITVFNQDQELRYTWVYNPTFDYHATEVIGKQDRDLLPEDDATILTRIKRHVLETGSGVREEVKLTMQNQDFYYDLAVEPLQTEDGETVGVTCASIDVTERKQMELALQQSETTLNALIASSPIGVAFFDRNLRYIHANEALAVTNGIPLSEHLGRTLGEVLPEWAPLITPILQQVMETQEPLLNQEVVGVTYPANLVRYALINYFPVCLPNGQVLGVGVTSVDISDRKQAEIALQQSEQQFRLLADAMPQIVWIADAQGKPEYVSQRWIECTGLTLAQTTDQSQIAQVIHPDDLKATYEIWQSCLATGNLYQTEFRLKQADVGQSDQAYRWFLCRAIPIRNQQGQISQWYGTLTDLDDHKQTEAALSESEARFRTLTTTIPQLIWTATPDGSVDYLSDQWADYIGLPTEQLYNWNWQQVVHPDDLPNTLRDWARSIQSGTPLEIQHRFRHHTGEWRWQLVRGVPIQDRTGHVTKWVGTCTDIHESEMREQDARFLSDLSEVIRTIENADQLMIKANEMIGQYLQLKRCYFAQTDETNDHAWIASDYHHDSLPSLVGEHRLSHYQPVVLELLRSGHLYISNDNKLDPRSVDCYETVYEPLAIRAHVAVPFHTNGRWAVNLIAATDEPRQWQEREINLLETVAERVWLAVEKRRSEAALRQSEERYRLLVEAIPQFVWITDAAGQNEYVNQRYCDYTGLRGCF
ncbi:MAG TPA: PAS domain S-box protein [Leptolyngbyaceae cyanobacterium M33_DOE_097]|uniref:histidine kinase n=1 Tax=Oscillatoriales cyanobacterium SpSt-418 TaxID=2282169 RepID=A0A7C3KFW7_9CYAN|nr:PAS domain S-box protein [Leptolyngbyaceae cyanobacterium M33_DOE_097]